MRNFLNSLKSSGFKPKTIIDGGVAHGTGDLYKTFPDAYYYLFEPIKEFTPFISKNLEKIKGEHHIIAISDKEGKALIRTPWEWKDDQPYLGFGGSSMFWDNEGPELKEKEFEQVGQRTRIIEQTTLDIFFKNVPLEEPVLLKTDLQGYDLKALQGATKTVLKKCEIVISEISPIGSEKTEGITEYTVFMSDQGFVCADIIDPLRYENERLMQVDACFIKRSSDFLYRK